MFTNLQQKDISGFLTHLWNDDPFKVKWSILAKAYSLIRDNKGKDQAPLNSFLGIHAPLLAIIPPTEYLAKLGWTITTDEDNKLTLTRNTNTDNPSFDQNLLSTNLSVEDVIQHSYTSGYIFPDADGSMIVVSDGFTMTMATTAQPNVQSGQQTSDNAVSGSGSAHALNTGDADTASNLMAEGLAAAEKEFEKQLIEAMLKEFAEEEEKEKVTNHAALLGNNVLGQALLDSGDQFPFNSQFDPADDTPLHYDPFMGDPFNPFDMSDYVNKDMFSAN